MQESCDIIHIVKEPDYNKNNEFFFFQTKKLSQRLKNACILVFSILGVRSLNRIHRSIQIKSNTKGISNIQT